MGLRRAWPPRTIRVAVITASWTLIAAAGYANTCFASTSFVANMLVWGIIVVATQFMIQVGDEFGPGVLWKLMTGATSSAKGGAGLYDLRCREPSVCRR